MSATLDQIREFLSNSREPVIVEPGEPPLALVHGRYSLERAGSAIRLEAWDDTRMFARKIRIARPGKLGRLELEVERFGGTRGWITIIDRFRGTHTALERKSARWILRNHVRGFLGRHFTGWRIAELTTEPDLEHSLSPNYTRALVTRAGSGWAVLAAPDQTTAADQSLTYGLIWLDYLRHREKRLRIEGLCLFVPAGKELTTCLRLPWLNQSAVTLQVVTYGENWEAQAAAAPHGNLETHLPLAGSAYAVRQLDSPEASLEQKLREEPRAIDPLVVRKPIYRQVPAWAGIERGILDLLACEASGRLVVIELKASADPHLPLQALDYWLRVRWHLEQGDFPGKGYFRGIALLRDPPRMVLVAPALAFHPTTEIILHYFSRSIDVQRVGVAVEWQKEIRVLFRLRGAQRPYLAASRSFS